MLQLGHEAMEGHCLHSWHWSGSNYYISKLYINNAISLATLEITINSNLGNSQISRTTILGNGVAHQIILNANADVASIANAIVESTHSTT